MELGLPIVLAMLLGFFLKRQGDEVIKKLIPIILFASQFLARLLLELGVGVSEAGAIGDAFRAVGPSLLDILRDSVLSTLIAVGTQSSFKNAGPQLVKALKAKAAAKAAEALAKVK